jgi:hypothetical protein
VIASLGEYKGITMGQYPLKTIGTLGFIIISLMLVIACISLPLGGDLGSGKHVIGPAEIIDIGDCHGGDGFFAGPRTCAISAKWPNSIIEYGETWSKVIIGQKVYKECWMEENNEHCFLGFTARPRDLYLKNN